ncbi:collagenase 3-like isoform X1 [Styela clava]
MWIRTASWILLLFSFDRIYCMPKPPDSVRKTRQAPKRIRLEDAAKYLWRYGYVSKTTTSKTLGSLETLDESTIGDPLMRFQQMAGIRVTGELDGETLRYMTMPRCGVDDTVGAFSMRSKGYNTRGRYEGKKGKGRGKGKGRKNRKGKGRENKGKSRTKRYDLHGAKWEKKKLTYKIINHTPDMTETQVESAMRRALDLWAAKSSLRFQKTSSDDADITISFGTRNHGDHYAFDGKGGTLAHAFFPTSGQAHFDDDEDFSHKGEGTNLYIVAAHEFGHSLGLAHSTVPNSLMAPFYQGYVEDFELHPDDIAAIQQLYGKNVDEKVERGKKPPPTLPPKKVKPTKKPRVNVPDLCSTNVDAMLEYKDAKRTKTYAFKGSYYYELNDYGVVPGFPKKIGKNWERLPGNLNAAAHSKITGFTYFFKGDKIYCYKGKTLRAGFPKKTQALGLPSHPTAVLSWGYDGMFYIFKKKNFYVFNEFSTRVPRPRHISGTWRGVPEGIDAAITWTRNRKTYFFKGNKYWRFNNYDRKVDEGYPQNLNEKWFGCDAKGTVDKLSTRNGKSGRGKNRGKGIYKNDNVAERQILARFETLPGNNGTKIA